MSAAAATAPAAPSFLRLSEVARRTGLGRSTIYERIAQGTFPAPVKLSERTSAWVDIEVQDWIAARIAERPAR